MSCDWDATKAFNAVVESLEWRFGSGATALRPQDIGYKEMQPVLAIFPCFVAGHGMERGVSPAAGQSAMAARPWPVSTSDVVSVRVSVFIWATDIEGRPVVVIRMDGESALTNADKLKAMIFAIEHGIANVLPDKQPAVTLLIDFKGFGMRHINPKLGMCDAYWRCGRNQKRVLIASGSVVVVSVSSKGVRVSVPKALPPRPWLMHHLQHANAVPGGSRV